MQALVLEKNKKLVIKGVDVPSRPGPNWALLRVAYCGLCQSDLHRTMGGGAYHYPLIIGHEFSGVVQEMAQEGERLLPVGTPVTAFPLIPCHKCQSCERGEYALCSSYDYIGSRRDGAMAQLVWVPDENLFPLPSDELLPHAALTELSAVAIHAARRLTSSQRSLTNILIIGDGPLALLAGQAFSAIAPQAAVTLSAKHREKMSTAQELGLSAQLSAELEHKENAFDGVLDCVGSLSSLTQALGSAAPHASVLLVGNPREEMTLSTGLYSSILRKELTLLGSWNSSVLPSGESDWDLAVQGLSSFLQIAPLVSHILPLEEAPKVIEDLYSHRMIGAEKILFRPSAL